MKKTLWLIYLAGGLSLMFNCATTSETFVNGVRVENPLQDFQPEIISLPYSAEAAIDSIKLYLINQGFTIKDTDRRLGIIQTDEKLLDRSEDFEHRTSSDDEAIACCLASALVVGAAAVIVAATSDDKKNSKNYRKSDDDDDDDDCHHVCTEEKPDVVQTKGRLQIIASRKSDSAQTSFEITAYHATYTNGIKEKEYQAIRLHPFVQKYACQLSRKNCGRAPGQKIIPAKISGSNDSSKPGLKSE